MNRFPKPETLLKLLLIVILAVLPASGCGLGDAFGSYVNDGNRLYAAKKYDPAMKSYHDAETERPDSPVVNNNMGDVFYKTFDYKKAEELFRKTSDTAKADKPVIEKAHYNLGNALFRQDKLDEAVLEFKQALELDPNDLDAKFNLEFTRIKLKEELSKKQNPKNGRKSPSKNQNQNNKNSSPKQNPGQGQNKQQQASQNKSGGAGKKENGDMSKREAMKILQALDNKEKQNKNEQKIAIPAGSRMPEKDW